MSKVWHVLKMGTYSQQKADELSLSQGQAGSALKEMNPNLEPELTSYILQESLNLCHPQDITQDISMYQMIISVGENEGK